MPRSKVAFASLDGTSASVGTPCSRAVKLAKLSTIPAAPTRARPRTHAS
jgi:hypothetical protein